MIISVFENEDSERYVRIAARVVPRASGRLKSWYGLGGRAATVEYIDTTGATAGLGRVATTGHGTLGVVNQLAWNLYDRITVWATGLALIHQRTKGGGLTAFL